MPPGRGIPERAEHPVAGAGKQGGRGTPASEEAEEALWDKLPDSPYMLQQNHTQGEVGRAAFLKMDGLLQEVLCSHYRRIGLGRRPGEAPGRKVAGHYTWELV